MPAVCCLVSRIFPAGLFHLGDEGAIQIGRAPDNNVVLPHDSVSRYHAEIAWKDGGHRLRDLGSSNGTFVDEQRIAGEHLLRDGDVVTIGPFPLRYREADSVDPVLAEAKSSDTSTARLRLEQLLDPVRQGDSFTGRQMIALAHILALRRQDGVLRIQGSAAWGSIELHRGEIVRAESGTMPEGPPQAGRQTMPEGLPQAGRQTMPEGPPQAGRQMLTGRLAAWSLLAQDQAMVRLEERPKDAGPGEPLPGGTESFLMDIQHSLDLIQGKLPVIGLGETHID